MFGRLTRKEKAMKHILMLLALALLTATLHASPNPVQTYTFRSVIGIPCGGDLPTDLCTAAGDAIAKTKEVLRGYSEQGWQLVSTTSVLYAPGSEAVVYLLRLSVNQSVNVKPQQFQIVMGMSCGQGGPTGLPSQLCTASGATVEETLNGLSMQGWQLASTTSCKYPYDQADVGMAVYLLSK
jgi:hypothetical protein